MIEWRGTTTSVLMAKTYNCLYKMLFTLTLHCSEVFRNVGVCAGGISLVAARTAGMFTRSHPCYASVNVEQNCTALHKRY
jgi:hypothetical protein